MLLAVAPDSSAAQLQSARVRGTVVDSTGQPVPRATIILVDPLGAVVRDTVTDLMGAFAFEDVALGRFAVSAMPASGSHPVSVAITLESALPLDVLIRLPPRVEEAIHVEARLDAASTRTSLATDSLAAIPARIRGRSLQDAVATLPGWATEDNGLLHARGVDDGFLYVIDGVPVYERLDALNGVAPETAALGSITAVTGYVPPEFGYKAGGVIEVRTSPATDRWRGVGDIGAGTFATADGSVTAGGRISPRFGVRLAGSSLRSDRYLDPIHPDNLHNTGHQAATSGGLDYRGGSRDRGSVGWMAGRASYEVPNAAVQDEGRQDQGQQVWNVAVTGAWQRTWTDRTVTQVAAYTRHGGSELDGSDRDVPLYASADRSLRRAGVLASVSQQYGRHLVKAGLEGQALWLHEDFTFAVTDQEAGEEAGLSDAVLEHNAGNPFVFSGHDRPGLLSMYLQDTWQPAAGVTLAAGLRLDRSTQLLDRHQWSPRLGGSWQVAEATVLRVSASRFFQPPQPEYLLLSSSEEARALSPFVSADAAGGADIEPERQWAYEAGVEQRLRHWRLDASYWRRQGREVADPNVFVGTTVIFPNAVARGRAQGVDVRVEVPRWHGWSVYGSATVSKVIQTGPITGGLFLEDEIANLGPGVEFVPDHDQRIALAGGLTWEHETSALMASLTSRYESGTPLQRDAAQAELEERPGAEMVDFDRGRVRPRLVVSLLAAVPLVDGDRWRVRLRGSVLNLFDRAYAYNFGNPFSGTHFGAPRTAAVSLEVTVR
jgi:outer membrane receptor for ferrienterochelin and colicin